ncbi:Endolytic murein transglycosylase [Moorella humiferrea]|uniref:endolytic transglycosylase MltG n=1 Tax=Neomoorella humiferrea TaxID=676965 RepID=UPI0030CD37F1
MEEETDTKRRIAIFAVLFSIILFLIVGVYFYNLLLPPEKPGAPALEVYVAPGATSAVVAAELAGKGIIKSPWAFRLLTSITGLDRKIKPGYYLISPGLSLREILDLLAAGKVEEIEFTVPEGYTVRQIDAMLQQKGLTEEEEFLQAAVRHYPFDFLPDDVSGPERLEGFLFPDTYRVAKGTPPEEIIMMMLRRFQEVYQEISREKDPGLNLDTKQIVILASIVEKEARVDSERPLIAGVYVNRLNKGMRLEADPTIQYLLPEPKPVLTYKDLEIESPYNTYRVNGLPPGPIANPGRASLLAALRPAKTDYLYFVAKPDGTHYFSRTLDEHNQAVARYQTR